MKHETDREFNALPTIGDVELRACYEVSNLNVSVLSEDFGPRKVNAQLMCYFKVGR